MHLIDQVLNHMLRGEFDEGWKISEQLEAIGPDKIQDPSGKINKDMWTRHQFNRGWFLLQQGNFQEGSRLLESGRFLEVYGSGYLPTTKPIWHNEPLQGKSIIISLEGGFGDEIIHVRFAESLAKQGAEVIVAAAPEMHSIFSRVPGVSKVITRSKQDVDATPHDFWIPGFSVGWVAGHTYDDLPNESYITASPESVEAWKGFINTDKLKIGIRWSGNPKFEHQQFRQFDASWLTNLKSCDDVQLFSFQRDNDTRELDSSIVDLQHILISWEDTLAALSQMDLVITSCTSIAHAAAAMGKPTWVIVPILPYHTWALGAPIANTSPWYPSVRLFRQNKFGKWDDTFEELYAALKQEYNIDYHDIKEDNAMSDEKFVDVIDVEAIDKPQTDHNGNKQRVFIAGLPKSGGGLLQQLLTQNDNIMCSEGPGLFNLLANINSSWNSIGCIDNSESKLNVLKSVFDAYYKFTDRMVVVDSYQGWISSIPIIELLTDDTAKLIVPVRNPAEIVAAFEVDRKANVLNPKEADMLSGSTITARCMSYSSQTGPLGLSHAQIMDAVTSGYRDRLLFVDYNKLCNEPKTQLKRIYDFLNIKAVEHQTSDVIKKQNIVPADIIGYELYQQYNTQIFWQNWI